MRSKFGKISLLSTPDHEIVALASNHHQIAKTVWFLWKVHKTHVWGSAEQDLAKSHFSAQQMLKSSYWPQIFVKWGKRSDFYKKCTKRTFGASRIKFWQDLTFRDTRCQSRRTGLKSSPNRENSAISIKSEQNARLGPCGASIGKSWLFRTDVKIVVLAWKHRQIGKTVRFVHFL